MALISFDVENLAISSDISVLLIVLFFVAIFFIFYFAPTKLRFAMRKRLPAITLSPVEEYKHRARILFIDDNDSPVARNLKGEGWSVEQLYDAQIDDQKIREANIIFVDWKGVGTRISADQEGISLANLLKRTYKHKKYIILYSVLETMKPEAEQVDDWIRKGSDIATYIEKISRASYILAL